MTDWIKWDGGACPVKSDETRVEYKLRGGICSDDPVNCLRWSNTDSWSDIIAYRIVEDYEPKEQPMTRKEIMAQIEALQKQLDAMPEVTRMYYDGWRIARFPYDDATHSFDVETINGVPHINGIEMKEVEE